MGKTEEGLIRMREGKGDVEDVMEKIKSRKAQQVDEALTELELEKLKLEIQKLREQQKPVSRELGTGFLNQIMAMAQVDPQRAKQFLDSLSEEDIAKLSMLSAVGQSGGMGNFLPLLKGGSNIQDIVTIVKLLQDNRQPKESGTDLKGIAEIFKAGVEAAKAQNPQPQQDPLTIYKAVSEMMQPIISSLGQKDKEIIELRMKELQSQIVNPIEYIKQMKSVSGELGLSPAGKSEIDLKLAEMGQTERLETRKLDLEEKKWEHEKANEGKTIQQVKEILEGPVGEVLKTIGSAGADRMRGSAKSNSGRIVPVKCPACGGVFSANEQLATLSCPLCGIQLARGTQPTPQEQPSQPAQVEQTAEAPAEGQSVVEKPASQ